MFELKNYDLNNAVSRARMLRDINLRGDEIIRTKARNTNVAEMEAMEIGLTAAEEAERLAKKSRAVNGTGSAPHGFDAQAYADRLSRVDVKASLPGPRDLDTAGWREAFEQVSHRKSWRGRVDTKSPTTIGLPAVVDPTISQQLPVEPDRLLQHFPSKSIDYPVVEYYSHTGNANPAAVVAELGVKPDLGMQLVARTATVQKIAALASVSMEALNDFETFQLYVPAELQRAVIDAETHWAAGQIAGFTGTLSRTKGSEGPLDTISEAFDDLRIGAAFATADLVAVHPTTWGYLRRQKDSYGRYLLSADPSTDQVNNIWGVRVVTNTALPVGTAYVFDTSCLLTFVRMGLTMETNHYGDTEWTTNTVSFRCEERLAIGALRPAGVNVVTGLTPPAPASAPAPASS